MLKTKEFNLTEKTLKIAENEGIDKKQTFDYCHAKEDQLRPTGQYIVNLKEVVVNGTKKSVYHACNHKQEEIIKSRSNGNVLLKGFQNVKQVISFAMISCLFILFISTIVMAQPGLPTPPSQAPIDGGLGLLAAAGGAYAWKKLRDKKNIEEE